MTNETVGQLYHVYADRDSAERGHPVNQLGRAATKEQAMQNGQALKEQGYRVIGAKLESVDWDGTEFKCWVLCLEADCEMKEIK